jgi:rhodanese-related sulfurtransferase
MVAVIRPIPVAADDLATVTVQQAEALRKDGTRILDVRRSEEWRETGIVPGSILVTAFDAEGRLNSAFLQSVQQQTDSTQPLMLICRSGNRSAKISTLLQQAGYTHLYNVAGGIRAWQSEGLPVERCASC